jgi:hypothetical protein
MLKLEKARNRDINISFRPQQKLFTRSFLIAFSIAFSLHLLAVLIFQVHAFFLNDRGLSSPVMVEVDNTGSLEDAEEGTFAFLEKQESVKQHRLAPSLSEPYVHALPKNISKQHVVLKDTPSSKRNPFFSIEEDWQSLVQTNQPPKKIKIHVSGPLAEFPSIDDQLHQEEAKLAAAFAESSAQVKYEVRIDHQTGKIFKQEIENPRIAQATADILNKIRFKKDSKHFVTAGEIEFSL